MKVKLEVSEKEAKRIFEKRKGWFFKGVKFNEKQRKAIIAGSTILVFTLAIILTLNWAILTNKDNISKFECNSQIENAIYNYEPSTSFNQIGLKILERYGGFLVFGLVIGWILHGVGFHIIRI